ncbi:MAG: glycosyltransferase family 4 protein [Clostridia bacterium]
MKILIITQYFYPETFRVNALCEELVLRGHEVTVLTGYPQYPYGKIYDGYGFNKAYEKQYKGAKVCRIKMLPRGKTPIGLFLNCASFVFWGNKWVKKCTDKYDAIYVFEVSPVTVGLPAVNYKEKFGTPIFFNVQDLWPENVEVIMGIKNKIVISTINKIVDKIYENSDRILCSSNGFIDNISKRGVNEEKLVFWPQFCNEPDLENISRPAMLSTETFNVVFTGNVGKSQGLDILIKAMKELKKEKVHCYVVGDGNMLDVLKNLSKDIGVSDVVKFAGKVSEHEANEYVKFANVAYLSLVDNVVMDMTIPAKLQTYLSCGTPVLAAVNGECADIIRNNQCGVCVGKTEKDISNAILNLKDQDKQYLENMGNNARLYYNECFNKEKLVDKLENIIRSVQ